MRLRVCLGWIVLMLLPVLVQAQPSSSTAAPDARAQPDGPVAAPDADEAPEQAGIISLEGALTLPTAYVFRGYVYDNTGWIFQPELTLSLNLPQLQENDVVSITPYVGTWNSIHENKSPEEPRHWLETDFVAGVDFEIDAWTVGLVYYYYISPGEAFEDVQELGITLSYDDSELGLLPLPLNPYVGVFRELDVTELSYLEVGLEPTYEVNVGSLPVTLTMPLVLGMSVDDYYVDSDGDEETIGYWSVGLNAAVPLEFLNQATGGQWELNVGVNYYYLQAQSAQDSNHDRDDRVVGSVGLGFAF